jgi:TetR/AcrR family transcriptional regulator, mexJK operon transcriptional repressor
MSTNSSDHNSAISAPLVRRARGRPRDLEKREAILEAASTLFFERGITATTVDSVAERAAVSKMTVYAYFADKPALLAAVFDRNTKSFRLPELAKGEDLESSIEHLDQFGERLISFLTRPEIIKSAWMMAESADQYPDLAAAFYAAGPGAMLAKVTSFLRSLVEHGLLAIDDPELVAEQLLASWLGLSQLQQSLRLVAPPSTKVISRRVRFATRAMLRAWSPPP